MSRSCLAYWEKTEPVVGIAKDTSQAARTSKFLKGVAGALAFAFLALAFLAGGLVGGLLSWLIVLLGHITPVLY